MAIRHKLYSFFKNNLQFFHLVVFRFLFFIFLFLFHSRLLLLYTYKNTFLHIVQTTSILFFVNLCLIPQSLFPSHILFIPSKQKLITIIISLLFFISLVTFPSYYNPFYTYMQHTKNTTCVFVCGRTKSQHGGDSVVLDLFLTYK